MARLFDQSNPDYIEIGDVVSVDLTGNKVTMSVWMKVTALNGEQKFFAKWADNGDRFQYLLSIDASDKVICAIFSGGVTIAIGSTTTPTQEWLHIAGTYDGSNIRVYLNGVEDGSAAKTGNMPNTTAPLRLGAGSGTAVEQPFEGELGHGALWNAALSADEIKSLAAGVSPLKIHKNNNLVFYAPLNGQSPELDVIEGLDLTLVGTTKSEEPPIPNSIVAP